MRVYGLAAEIFQESLIPFLPRVLQQLSKKLRDGDHHLHQAISESSGVLSHCLLKNLESIDEQIENLSAILKMVFSNLAQQSKIIQTGASMCLLRII